MSTHPPSAARERSASPRPGVRTRGAATVLLLAGLLGLAFGTSVGAAPPEPTPAADAALDWLGAQLVANGNTIPGFGGSTDWGMTADAVLAFVAAGRGADAPAQAATDQLAASLTTYTTWDPDVPGVRVAGASAKVLLALAAQGRDVHDVGGVDLEAVVRALMATTGANAGRFMDQVPDPAWDTSNGFGQTLSMLALALTPGGVPDGATEFLLAQQCPAGGFRLTYDTTGGCVGDDDDTDTTAMALQALLAVDRTPEVEAALVRGIEWLLARQDPTTGSFSGTGPTAAPNSNSAGLIAQTLRAAGQIAAADRAATWITSTLQLDAANTAGSPAAADLGAIAYNRQGFDDAVASGIATNTADQWWRATSQAVLALGLAPYGPTDVDPVVVPPTTTTTTTTSTSTTTTTTTVTEPPVDPPAGASGGVTPVAGATGAGAAAAGTTGTAGATGTVGATDARSASSNRAAANGRDTAAARLATTGGDRAPLTLVGVVALLAGLLVLGTERRLRTRSRA